MKRALTSLLTILLLLAMPAPAEHEPDRGGRQARRRAPVVRPQPGSARQKFVLDVVRTAVSLPQADPQDRLRVLHSAISVAAPLSRQLARQYAREGAKLEAGLVANGEKPAVSILSLGTAPCDVTAQYVEMVPAAGVVNAEDSLVAAVTLCPKESLDGARMKAQTALDNGVVASRLLLALMDRSGADSRWSQELFARMFASLPTGPEQVREAANYAAMFMSVAPKVDKDVARDTGLRFLGWLAKMPEAGERNLAVTVTTDVLKQVLGEEKYQEMLRRDVMAQQIAQTAGRPGEIERPEEESVSVLEAMGRRGEDRTEALREMPSSLRAREAAASGFATGTAGDKKQAERYFDMAFSAADEVWSNRGGDANAVAVVEEVSQAAAHVDPVAALARAQKLQEPPAQAIAMLAVARVASTQGN